jgi:hypothetical protein
VARAIVSLANKPRPSVTIGSIATFLKLAHVFFPALSRSITAKTVKTYLNQADNAPETSGNLFAPAKFGTSIHGGWNSPADAEIRRKAIIKTAVLSGLAIGLASLGGYKLMKKNITKSPS